MKAARERDQLTYNSRTIRRRSGFLLKTVKVRKAWAVVLQTQEHKGQPRLLYPAKLSFTINEKRKMFHEKEKIQAVSVSNSALQKVLEGKLQPKEVNYTQENKGINNSRSNHNSE